MRLPHRIMLAGLAGLMLAAPVSSQKPDDQIHPRSLELLRQGETLLAAGKFVEADDVLEAALAVDPRNRAAFVVMARVAQKQKLFGQAIRFTNKALALEPRDLDALSVQGEAMVELGAVPRARDNLAKLQKLCPSGCSQLASLSAAISRGPTAVASVKPPASPKTN
ncbi:MAG TPA: tetratricopeptide repeat protein [Sphingomicrobium sp.]|nr:tetratricopeptide repeat protein [Sphingomicrobium sp.]